MNITTVKETIQLSWEGKITFPQVVGMLLKENIESYHVDFLRKENTYYPLNGDSHRETVPYHSFVAEKKFSAEAVATSIRKIQSGKINYQNFVEEVMSAGCIYYIAYLAGKRVIYFGREGDFHVEHFPKN
jgi:uncharacterized protein YbcV (DUF1398 family)